MSAGEGSSREGPSSRDGGSPPVAASRGGSPLVAARIVLDLLLDVASTPFHVVAFLLTRRRHKERFSHALAESCERGPDPVP